MQTYDERRASLGLFGEPNQADPEPTSAAVAQWLASKGYTLNLYADCEECSMPIWVKPTADLDGTFTAWDDDEGEFIKINGWLWTFEPIVYA